MEQYPIESVPVEMHCLKKTIEKTASPFPVVCDYSRGP